MYCQPPYPYGGDLTDISLKRFEETVAYVLNLYRFFSVVIPK